jgi:thiol-disulfide isomerase/thioredoxin
MKWTRVAAIGFCLLLGMAQAAAQADLGRLSWRDTQGNTQNLALYKGKIVVLNFWATWCVPCRRDMPLLAEIQQKYKDKGVVVLGASVDDEKSEPLIQPMAEKERIGFPLLLGAKTDEMKELQLGEAIPATAFFDVNGTLVARVLGELDKSALEKRLDWMLGKHHGKAPPAFVNGFEKKHSAESAPSVFH